MLPKSLVNAECVMSKGQHITREGDYQSISFGMDTVSGQTADGDSTCGKKQHTLTQTPNVQVE